LNRLVSYLLLALYVALGTGCAAALHDLQHAAEDAREDATARAAGLPAEPHHHDDNNCDAHARLHLAVFHSRCVAVVLCLGLCCLSRVPVVDPLVLRRAPLRTACRGPPALRSSHALPA
jgi:hypothetical protein